MWLYGARRGGQKQREQGLSGGKDWPVEFFVTAREMLSSLFLIHGTTFSYGELVLKYKVAFNSQWCEILMS